MNTTLSNTSIKCVRDTSVTAVVFPILYSILFICALILNSLAAWIFFNIPSTSTFMVFLKNVVVADLLMTLTIPVRILSDAGVGSSQLRAFHCRYSAVLFYITMYISILLLGLISLDRYLKIVKPFGKGALQKVRVGQLLSAAIWVVMLSLALPNIILSDQPPRISGGRVKCTSMKNKAGLLWHEGFNYFCQVVFWGTLALMVVCYTFISKKVYESYKASKSRSQAASRRTKAKVFVVKSQNKRNMADYDERQSLLGDESDGREADRGPGRPMPAICDPSHLLHRVVVLVFMCFLGFGSYFCYDNPAALQTQVIRDLNLNTKEFMQLYAWYSWPNVVLCFFGGFMIDRVFGIRLGTIIFSLFVCVGQVIFATGAWWNKFWLMEVGRFVFGIGGESLAVAQNTYAVNWFKGKELNLVFGLQLSMARLGSTVNMNIMGSVYSQVADLVGSPGHTALGASLMIAAVTCLFSLICALVLGFLDKRAEKILHKEEGKTGEVVKLTDVKDFPLPLWLIFIICVGYYVAIFPFIGLGQVFFIEKFNFSPAQARAVNSIVYIISAPASPVLGFMVDKTGRNVIWVIIAVVTTLCAHMMLAFTFWNPWIAMSLLGLSYSLLACALWPMVAFVVPEHQLGTAYGFMQSIQNLGLALIAMAAGAILDSRGYLLLEVFFCACVCIALMAVVTLYFVDYLRGGDLNRSAAARAKLQKEATSEAE